MEPWEGIVQIPEGQSGDHLIEHFTRPAGPVERSNLRTAFIGGQADKPVFFDRETTWHRLSYSGGVWMTDLPIEQQQHDNELKGVTHGSVLIGGLGVGYAVNILAARPDIKRIVVVELSQDVINLVGDHIKDPEGKVEIVQADLMDFVKVNTESFDFAFYDIWQSDAEETFFNVVLPLRMHSWLFIDHSWMRQQGIDDQIICWNENVMRGQLLNSLRGAWMMARLPQPESSKLKKFNMSLERCAEPMKGMGEEFWNWRCPFFKELIRRPRSDEEAFELMSAYCARYGRQEFDEWWEEITAK